jgi:hypothetical protein
MLVSWDSDGASGGWTVGEGGIGGGQSVGVGVFSIGWVCDGGEPRCVVLGGYGWIPSCMSYSTLWAYR